MYAHAHGGEEMIFENKKKATLILADGTEFEGRAFGADGSVVGEIVFTPRWWAIRRPSPTRATADR